MSNDTFDFEKDVIARSFEVPIVVDAREPGEGLAMELYRQTQVIPCAHPVPERVRPEGPHAASAVRGCSQLTPESSCSARCECRTWTRGALASVLRRVCAIRL